MTDHPDFKVPWCASLLTDPNIQATRGFSPDLSDRTVSNSLFNRTLSNEDAIRAQFSFRRQCKEPTVIRSGHQNHPTEDCILLSLGDALDGKAGRLHGGFSAMVLDQITGSCAHYFKPDAIPPATATITVDFKSPVSTPCVVLARAWVTAISGRKIWVSGVLEDGMGGIYAVAKGLFILGKPML
jgi:acyl-coenzyme A thioesterase PaaI-like protein